MRRFVLAQRAYDPIARRMRDAGEIITLPDGCYRTYRPKLGEEVTGAPEDARAPQAAEAEQAVKPRKRRKR